MKIKIVLKIVRVFGKAIHLVFSLTFLLGLCYFFGHKLLSGGLIGNDSANGFSMIIWLDKYFPHIPLWYPLQGTGTSFVQGYQVLPLLVVVWLHRFSSLTLLQSYEVLLFLSVYLSALGIYLLSWSRLKSQTVGLFAGVFFLLAPTTWVWSAQAGFFTAAFSLIFVAPAFLFTDWYFEYVFTNEHPRKRRIIFLLAVLFLSLALLSHFTAFMALFITFIIYQAVYWVLRKKDLFKSAFILAKSGFQLFFSAILISAFWFIPFYSYNSFANWDRSNTPNPNLFPAVNVNSFLSIPTANFKYSTIWTFSFPLFVWSLALLAILVAAFYSRRIVALALASSLVLFFSISIWFYVESSKISPFLASGFSPRVFWVAYNILGPVLAAYSLVYFFQLLVYKLPEKFLGRLKLFNIFGHGLQFLGLVVAVFVGVYLIIIFRSVDKSGGYSFAHYGPVTTYQYMITGENSLQGGLDLRDIWGKSFNCVHQVNPEKNKQCEEKGYVASFSGVLNQLQLSNWPKINLNNHDFSGIPPNVGFLSYLPKGENLRMDISPNSFGSLTEELPLYRQDISLLNTYTFQLSLNHTFWAAAQGVFYSEKGEAYYTSIPVLNDFAADFGINYVLLGEKDPVDKFEKAGWKEIKTENSGVVLVKAPTNYDLVSVDSKKSILAIGNNSLDYYQNIYKMGKLGAFTTADGYLVMGKDKIDDYSLEELKKFNTIVLFSYQYNSFKTAWGLLKKYVEQGGNLFVDTGWQYNNPDWQLKKTPDLLPTERLEWMNLPLDSKFVLSDKNNNNGFDITKFNPLKWGHASWGVSTSKSLKNGFKTVLSYDGYPLVAEGQVGQGRVVWSGMNLIPHALSGNNDNLDEVKFFGSLLNYLNAKTNNDKTFEVDMSRPNPDKVEFTTRDSVPENSNLYFREAYIPNWVGFIQTQDGKNHPLNIYRAGPGLMIAKLPGLEVGDKVIFEYRLTLFEISAYFISALTLICLTIAFLDLFFLKGTLAKRFLGKFKFKSKQPKTDIGSSWWREGDEDDK